MITKKLFVVSVGEYGWVGRGNEMGETITNLRENAAFLKTPLQAIIKLRDFKQNYTGAEADKVRQVARINLIQLNWTTLDIEDYDQEV